MALICNGQLIAANGTHLGITEELYFAIPEEARASVLKGALELAAKQHDQQVHAYYIEEQRRMFLHDPGS